MVVLGTGCSITVEVSALAGLSVGGMRRLGSLAQVLANAVSAAAVGSGAGSVVANSRTSGRVVDAGGVSSGTVGGVTNTSDSVRSATRVVVTVSRAVSRPCSPQRNNHSLVGRKDLLDGLHCINVLSVYAVV